MRNPTGVMMTGLCVALALTAVMGRADDYTFTNSVGSPSYNAAGNWDLGAVPGVSDNARFTNSATYTVGFSANAQNAAAVFDAVGGNVTLGIASSVWSLSNSLAVGPSAGVSPSVLLSSGTLAITNSGAGLLDIGTGGAGAFTIQGTAATSVVDRILVTNVVNGIGNCFLNLRYGSLTTLASSTILMATNGASTVGPNYGDFRVGPTNGSWVVMTWSLLGGTSYVMVPVPAAIASTSLAEPYPALMIGGNNLGLRGIVNVIGAGTVLSNYGGGRILVGAAHSWGGGGNNASGNNQLNIADGARVYNKDSLVLIGWAASGNSLRVSGEGSLLSARDMSLSKSGDSNALIVTNGAQALLSAGLSMGEGQGGSAVVNVSGSNSLLVCNNNLSFQGNTCVLLVNDGATLRTSPNLNMNDSNKAGRNNRFIVSGSGSLFTNAGSTTVSLTSKFKPATHSNVLLRVEQGGFATMQGELSVGWDANLSTNNSVGAVAVVTDPGSRVQCRDVRLSKYINDPTVNLVVSNGASLYSRDGIIASETVAANIFPAFAGTALVTGSNSLWRMTGSLYVGYASSGSLTVTNGGAVVSAGGVIGNSATATGNVLTVSSGSLVVTNSSGSALLDIRQGTFTVANNGSVTADKLTFTNTTDSLAFVAGTNGLGTVKVKGALTLLAGSKLTVDLSGYTLPTGQRSDVLTLFEYGSLPTPFALANVQRVSPRYFTRLVQGSGTNDKITLSVFRAGTMIAVY